MVTCQSNQTDQNEEGHDLARLTTERMGKLQQGMM